tara:strand:+ start:1744 stop:1869 length:126 start_codon:yes stop_codon:yes gene_type:complete
MKNKIVETKKGLQNKWQNYKADFKLFYKEVNKHYKRINDEL